jgi:murein DD-endopeptidase MepM/ murein hydrolase activator NlpD
MRFTAFRQRRSANLVQRLLRIVGVCVLTSLLASSTVDLAGPAQARSRRSLRARQSAVRANIRNLRGQIRNLKAEQATARNSLSESQVELEQAQGDLRSAAQLLSHTRSTLQVVRKDHDASLKRFQIQKKRMQARILAQFEAGNPSYLEVVLDAVSFADFTERADLSQTIIERDQSALAELLSTSRRLARQEALLQQKEQEEAQQKIALQRQRNTVAVKAEVAHTRLVRANTDRAEAERQLAAMEEASSEIASMLARVQHAGFSGGAYSGTWSGSLLRPAPGNVTSGFGWRIHPILHTRRFHDGVDLACSGGTPIRAADKGRVVHAGWWGAYGIAVVIDHGSGISTVYGHCMSGSIRVSAGEVVQRGQVIASVDSTGWSTGNHLHFSVRRFGTPINPMNY